jgi:hypothetical protein
MTRTRAAGLRILALGLLAAASAASLSGCADIDQSLFGAPEQAGPPPANTSAAEQPAPVQGEAPPAQGEAAPAPGEAAPEGAPPPQAAPVTAPRPAPVASAQMAPPAVGGEFTTVQVAPGADTGTTVSHTIAGLRSQLEALESRLAANAQHFTDARNSGAQAAASYQSAAAGISARLAGGTTRGNPELISEWNNAQGALDSLTGNLNGLGQLASDVSKDAADAHHEYDTIQSTFEVSGAVDEDHRQLSVLSDETGQTIVLLDRLLRDVKQTLQRQTAYVATERGHLTNLAELIKAGNYTGMSQSRREAAAPRPPRRRHVAAATAAPESAAPAAAAPAPAAASDVAAAITAGTPIISIKFNRAHVSFDHALYAALSQALAAKPTASFSVVAVTGSGGDAGAASKDADNVMRSMGEMGVPATRMSATTANDPAISVTEVRVFVK